MPYFVASDELTLATFLPRDLLFVMLFTCKISAKQYELAQYQCTYDTGYRKIPKISPSKYKPPNR